LPALQGVNNNRAAGLERLGQFPDGGSAHRIEDEAKRLPVESPLDVLLQVVALVDYTVASKLADLFGGLLKPLVFGALLALVSCYCGLRTYGGTQGVGRSTTQAVVASSVLILISDFFLTRLILAYTR